MYTAMTPNLMVKSVDKAITFYQEALGFSLVDSVPGKDNELQFAILQKDKLMLMMQERSNFIAEYPVLNTEEVHPSISLYIAADNLTKKDDRNSSTYFNTIEQYYISASETEIGELWIMMYRACDRSARLIKGGKKILNSNENLTSSDIRSLNTYIAQAYAIKALSRTSIHSRETSSPASSRATPREAA